MKKLRFLLMIFALMLIAGFSQLNAQVTQLHEPQDIRIFVACANDGLGEWISGTIDVHVVIDNAGSYIAHPQGQYVTGEDTGIKYRAVGATIVRFENYIGNGAIASSIVNRMLMVGKGTQWYLKSHVQFVMNSSGIVVYKTDFEITCK
ncbi:MAG: hypothetical protein GQ579_10310 [Bacteroidales bacterium]|nr:hypothetical protein [Bacteroidales bacterium]